MNEIDVIKGVGALKIIAKNASSILDFAEVKEITELLPYITEIQKGCATLTDIFEKAFTNMIMEKEREEDDGK